MESSKAEDTSERFTEKLNRWASEHLLLLVGISLTGGYLYLFQDLLSSRWVNPEDLGVYDMLMAELKEKDLNEIGDFLAGAFGPVAFLWLVIGYLQQGKELKNSSEALKRQADELSATVEQHKEMVGTAKKQYELYQQELDAKVLPKFSAKIKTIVVSEEQVSYLRIEVHNSGEDIEFCFASLVYSEGSVCGQSQVKDVIARDATGEIDIDLSNFTDEVPLYFIVFSFTAINGKEGFACFVFETDKIFEEVVYGLDLEPQITLSRGEYGNSEDAKSLIALFAREHLQGKVKLE